MQDLNDGMLKDLREMSQGLKKLFDEDPYSKETEEALRKEFDATGRVKTKDQGPLFVEGEVVPVKGYGYKVKAIVGQRIVLVPHVPLEATDED